MDPVQSYRTVEVRDLRPADTPTRALFRELLEVPGIWIYLHGSRADGTVTAFSDYDDFVVVDVQAVGAGHAFGDLARALGRVERRFQRLDPLQHHGHFLVGRGMLDAYDASYLPPSALRSAVVVRGPDRLRWRIDRHVTEAGLDRNIRASCRAVSALHSAYVRDRISAYRLKKLAGIFALMPAYLFQHAGEDLDKPEAIARAAEVLPEPALACIRWATECREGWSRVVRGPRATVYRLLVHTLPNARLYRRVVDRFAPRLPLEAAGLGGLPSEAVDAFLTHCRRRVDDGV